MCLSYFLPFFCFTREQYLQGIFYTDIDSSVLLWPLHPYYLIETCDVELDPSNWIQFDVKNPGRSGSFIISCSEMEPLSSSSSFLRSWLFSESWSQKRTWSHGCKRGGDIVVISTFHDRHVLVGGLNPSEKLWVRQLGWWHSRSLEKYNPVMFQSPSSVWHVWATRFEDVGQSYAKLQKDLRDLTLGVLVLLQRGLFAILFL